MYTLKELKERYINHLMSMDLAKMDIQELGQYSVIIKTLDDMEKPGYAETLMAMGMGMGAFGARNTEKEE